MYMRAKQMFVVNYQASVAVQMLKSQGITYNSGLDSFLLNKIVEYFNSLSGSARVKQSIYYTCKQPFCSQIRSQV